METIDHAVSTDLLSQPETPEDAQSVKVYSYTCKIRNAKDAALVQEQISLAHKHRNTLTEALLKGRTAHRAIIKEHLGLEIKELETEADQINSIIASGRADLCALARPHLSNPHFALQAAAELGYAEQAWPKQYLAGKAQLERLTRRDSDMAIII